METLWSELIALGSVILIDVVLAADNAVVVGLAAAGLPPHQRARAIFIGIVAATVLRIAFALVATQLLNIVGLLLAGGILLVWVSWKLWREIQSERRHARAARLHAEANGGGATASAPVDQAPKTLRQAATQIVIADVSMSLDNVLAVAGAARDHTWVLIVGLALSVALMGLAATFVVRLLKRFPWLSLVGLAVIVFVAGRMIYEGVEQILHATAGEETAIEGALDPAH